MKIILTTTLYLLLMILFFPATGQKKSSSTGYVITKTNDTLPCEFEAYNWKKQPHSIKVRINGNDTIVYPGEVSSFKNSSEHEFVSHEIELFRYNREVQNAVSGNIPFSETIPAAFLKVLYKGKINLYLYKDGLGVDHYFIEKISIIKEIYIHLYSSIGGFPSSVRNPHARQPVVVNNLQYYFGLKEMMQDCMDIFPEVDKTELNTKSLIALLKEYEKCPAASGN